MLATIVALLVIGGIAWLWSGDWPDEKASQEAQDYARDRWFL